MTAENETYIGDKNTFAIRYVSGYTDKDKKNFYAYCHLVLGGQIIGEPNESCFLNSWKDSLEGLKDIISNSFDSLSHPEFRNRSDKELFELIWKANQLEDEYKIEYMHLPVLDNKIWHNCHLSIDETTDAFLITVTEQNGEIKFLWKGWREPCPPDRLNKLYSLTVDRNFVIDTMEKCLKKIEEEYLNFPRDDKKNSH
jgi:hypothetical protein